MRRSGQLGVGLAAMLVTSSLGAWMPVGASDGDDHGSGSSPEPEAVTWTIDADSCSNVPEGTVIKGTGVLTVRQKETTRDGAIRRKSVARAEGTATDQAGNTYRWSYENTLVQRNSAATPHLFAGEMSDAFRLRGGPVTLRNGFEATAVDDLAAGTFGIYPSSAYGDPFNFPSGPNRCDPL